MPRSLNPQWVRRIEDVDMLTEDDVRSVTTLIAAVAEYRTIDDCTRDVIRAVQQLQARLG